MNFGRERGCGGPYLCAPHTSARIQNRVEFVDLARDMPSNCTGEVQAGTGISRYHSFHAVVRAHKYESIEYVEVREHHLYTMYGYINACVSIVSYVCRIWYLGRICYRTR